MAVILLLVIGILLCYKICNHYWPKRCPCHQCSFQHRRRNSFHSWLGSNTSDASATEDTEEDLEEGEFSGTESTTSDEDEECESDIYEGSLLEWLSKYQNASQNQPGEEQHPQESLSWSGEEDVTPKYASRRTSLDGSFMEDQLPTFSGSLVNRKSKMIKSTPETLQPSEISEAVALPQSDDEKTAKLESDDDDNNFKDREVSTGAIRKVRVGYYTDHVESESPRKVLVVPPGPANSESGTAQHSVSSAVGEENVSQRVELMEYAMREGQGRTKQAKTILKGYAEIPALLGLQYLRRIRGDNYCAIRSAIFQILALGIPIPSGAEAFQYLSQALNDRNCEWLQNWKFAGRLPYEGNVMHGMKVCLQYLDKMASLLSAINGNKEDMLATLLNSAPLTDLHIMEAVKLHMLHHAMQLYENDLNGQEIPFFAILMFARDTSKTPKDFMINHLRGVGDTGGLEQVEMCLLGYALGVTVRVVRPCAYGTEEFICSYPDYNDGNLPEIFLIAEEDVHYNVLVN